MICDFHNFYSKLPKMDKIINIWKQRNLTLFGKNIVINALLNSLIVFNCQIEYPPVDFMPLVDKKSKEFLWGVQGHHCTLKIAHNSIIAKFEDGGFNYKDLQSFIGSINIKFLSMLNFEKPSDNQQSTTIR